MMQLDADIDGYRGQFVLARDVAHCPPDWKKTPIFGWHLAVNQLPVRTIVDETNQSVGLCIGHPIGDAISDRVRFSDIEEFYENVGGSFILILSCCVMLDTCGTLPAVFHINEYIVASTPTLIRTATEWNSELITAINFPKLDSWFPFGLTSRRHVRRILPNHRLNLSTWSLNRFWPNTEIDLSVESKNRTNSQVECILETMHNTLLKASAAQHLEFTLTAGRDSRMVLASARDLVTEASFITFTNPAITTIDTHISTLLAKKFALNHRLLTIQECHGSESAAWLFRTGHAISGEICRIHKTLDLLDSASALVVGMAGEVGRAYYWKAEDRADTRLLPMELLGRLGMPIHPQLLAAATAWLEPILRLNRFLILDLLYLEQRLGCWAAPSRLGNVKSSFEFTPFNHRKVVSTMMRLPHAYRYHDQLPLDICARAWPALLELPFNRFTGIRGVRDQLWSGIKRIGKRVLRR